MSSVTGLQLLNRVLAFRRQPPVAAYSATDPEHVVILNAINMAKEDILGTRRWEFDLRHDGQIATKATALSRDLVVSFTWVQGLTSSTLTVPTTILEDETIGDHVLRVVPKDDTDYSDTAFRVLTVSGAGDSGTAVLSINSPKTIVSAAADLVYAEYLLPDTVREVVRASFDQNELSLEQLDPTVEFSECIPSPHLESGQPRVFSVGGYDRGTYQASASVPDPKLRAIVWPVPDDEYVISYSYYYRHADLASGTDTWTGIPTDVINDIVWQATSIVKMAVDGDYAASHFADMAQSQASAKHMAYSGSSGRRHTVGSWDTGGSFNSLREGFPGKLIG